MELISKAELPTIDSNDDMERICSILSPNTRSDERGEFEPPIATISLLEKYLLFLTPYLKPGLRLKASESMGYFSWEERYLWSASDSIKKEHKRLKQEYASTSDLLKLMSIQEINEALGITLKVRRPRDNKCFIIPLADLQAVDKAAPVSQIIDDYACYITNFFGY